MVGNGGTDTATAASQYGIQTRNLNLWYGDFQALQDVTVNIKPRVITALIGPSGCGKTTLLRCFNRINERYENVKTTGSVNILGKNIYDPNISLSELRKSVGMVFQRPNPLPISIYKNVLFGIRVHTPRGMFSRQQSDEMVESALRDVQLWDDVKDMLRKKATSFSLDRGYPPSMKSIPISANRWAMFNLSCSEKLTPSPCDPSRRGVSYIRRR